MDWKTIAFEVIGGLGMFLMGMKFMSESMQKVAGDKLRKILSFLTQNRFMAVGIGFLVTAIIQSSSATTVMTVGFVNATLLTLSQAIGVVLGANIGTTVTGWIVAIKIVKFAMPLIGIGVAIRFFSKNQKWRYVGEVVFGFGLLFLGMQTMKHGFAPLRKSADFIEFFTLVDGSSYFSILLGVLVGTVTTVVVQSSSATIGIAIALASQGLLNFEGGVALILGDNIGTTITAILASIGANHHAKRAAMAHTMFNVLGVLVLLIFFYPFTAMIEWAIPNSADFILEDGSKPYIGQHIAMAHTMFNITNVIIFIPLINVLAKVCTAIIKEPAEKENLKAVQFSHINESLITAPSLAIVESEKELSVMADKVRKNILRVHEVNIESSNLVEVCDKVSADEQLIDEYKKMVTEFLLAISSKSISTDDAILVGNYIEMAHSLEKNADYLENIVQIYDRVARKGMKLSQEAVDTINKIFSENISFYDDSVAIFNGTSGEINFIEKAAVKKGRIKKMVKDAKLSHFERLRKNVCKDDASVAYVDILNLLSSFCSQTFNLAEVATGSKYDSIN
jgi:phosphate:Na+ symporter